MAIAKSMRTVSLAALMFTSFLVPSAPGRAADANVPVIRVAASDAASRFIPLGKGKSVVIDLPQPIKDVLVADPKIANAVVRSARRVYLIGVNVGQTNIFFFNSAGQQIAGFNIAVTRDLNGLRALLKRTLPTANIQVEGMGKEGVVLTGTASSPADAQKAFDIATQLVGQGNKVVNAITVQGQNQVLLKVTVAEMDRDVVKQLGLNMSGSFGFMHAGVFNFNTDNPFSVAGAPISNSSIAAQQGITTDPITGAVTPRISATLRAMERAGVIRTLAEPNLTAVSGETASFLAGGEFPVPTGLECQTATTCQPSITYKKFGVSLKFTPVVLSAGRISLKVMTEVSDVSSDQSISLSSSGFNATVPSIVTRRADTVVEIPSGGSLALAGMIQQKSQQAINGLPGLMQVPVLGALFKSRDYLNHETELVIIVTPYVVHAVPERDLSQPDDGFEDPSDPAAALLGRLNRIYGAKGSKPEPASEYHGKYGFILD